VSGFRAVAVSDTVSRAEKPCFGGLAGRQQARMRKTGVCRHRR
jgi:hypothetical protein